jgi:hypothetical protein
MSDKVKFKGLVLKFEGSKDKDHLFTITAIAVIASFSQHQAKFNNFAFKMKVTL